jgi:hypothetical protein
MSEISQGSVFAIVAALAAGLIYLEERMSKKKVFISYDHSEDAKYRYLLPRGRRRPTRNSG